MTAYSYTVLRYVHDTVAGEAMNVGVLFYAPDARYVCFLRDSHYGHLAKSFAGFDHIEYFKYLLWLGSAVERFQNTLRQDQLQLIKTHDLPSDAGVLARQLVPDAGLSFQWGQPGAGLAHRVDEAAESIYGRMVSSQRPDDGNHKRRDDDDVWKIYQGPLSRHSITPHLHPLVVSTIGFEISLSHTFKNEKLHAIEPISFDYQDTSTIRATAARWAGHSLALQLNLDFSQLYLLLGKPTLEKHWRDYVRAKDFLRKIPSRPILVEETEAEDFARRLAAEMREHGILTSTQDTGDSEL